MINSTCDGFRSATVRARAAASKASVAVVSWAAAMWRVRMPVRWKIHSSVVSTIVDNSSLVTSRLGR